ncbi:MAG: hypothetical protein AAGM46_21900, partial [Cyanobacteria bacterium J06582_2]
EDGAGDGDDTPTDPIGDGSTPDDGEGDGTETPTDPTGDGSSPDDAEGDGEGVEDGDGDDTPTDPAEDGLIPDDGEVGIPVEGGGIVETVEPIEADGAININFGVPRVDTPSGFTQDIGEAYSAEQGFGWVTQDSAGSENLTPIDVVVNGRDRDTLFNDGQGGQFQEPVRDSLIHMQFPTRTGVFNPTAELTPAAWEYDLANGLYGVIVGVGDPEFFDSNHVINVEGESLISGFTPEGLEVNGNLPIGAQAFDEGSAIVEVDDGRLTVDAVGGENTKINYISIVPIDTL